jgi:acyl transferase domain-containing protein/4'-phosphopantetheinyl transferase EntD
MQGDVAIIGMACLFPGAENLDAYWQNVVAKRDAIADPPAGMWEASLYDPTADRNDRVYCKRGGYLGPLAEFDPLEHGMMPVAVNGSDPDQWLALRVARQAFIDAGYGDEIPERERTAVILGRGNYPTRGVVGVMEHGAFVAQMLEVLKGLHPEYTPAELQLIQSELKKGLPAFDADSAPGVIPNITAGRIANRLDLMGTSCTVDAACASSLVAVDMAVRELLTRQCDLALVGGVNLAVPLCVWLVFTQIGAFSRREQIRPFDKDADGTLPGEGVGMMVLKRLEQARRDGNRVYAVIKGVGTASDGRGLAVTAPRVEGEILALKRAYTRAGILPTTVELIEAHGTGTPVGDATELEALGRVFGRADGSPPRCALGSVKSMIGHLMPAAGIAGLIKTALALHHKVLPPTRNVDNPHPRLAEPGSRFYLNTEARPWVHGGDDAPRRAGVNAFGFGGINAHVILEENAGPEPAEAPSRHHHWESEVCILSAASRAELVDRAERLLAYLLANPQESLKDVAHTLNVPFPSGPVRLAVVAESTEDLGKKVERAAERLKDPQCRKIEARGTYFTEEPLAAAGRLAFLFPGEGSQYVNMCADLCLHFPEVRQVFDLIDGVWAESGHAARPSELLFPRPLMSEDERQALPGRLQQMDMAVSVMMAADLALSTVLSRLGIAPQALVGHSTGEFAALMASGMIDVGGEGRLRQLGRELRAIGGSAGSSSVPSAVLVAVGADRETVLALTERNGGGIHLAMDNCPHQSVIVGEERAIQSALERVRSRSLIHERLPFDRPYHTPLYGEWAESLRPFFTRWIQSPPRVRTYTCATAAPFPDDLEQIRTLAIEQWRRRVEFVKTVQAMYADGVRIFVEAGPRGNLTSFVDDILRGKPYLAVAADVPHRPGTAQLNHLVGTLAAHGVPMRLDYLYARRSPRRLALDDATGGNGRARPGSRITLATSWPAVSLSPEAAAQLRPSAPPVVVADAVPSLPPVGAGQATLSEEPASGQPNGQPTGADKVMAAYLRSVEDLVAAQEEVMRTFLAGGSTARPVRPPAVSPPPAPPAQAAPQAIQAPEPPASPPEQRTIPPAPATPQGVSGDLLLRLVSERTGYPTEMLSLDLDLEADLGIDSIKRVEILGSLQQQIKLPKGVDMEALAGRKTLRAILDVLATGPALRQGAVGRPAATAPEAPPARPAAPPAPLLSTVVSLVPGEKLEARADFDLADHRFLADHSFGRKVSTADAEMTGLPVVPLTVTMELMAEAAALLAPGQRLIGMRKIRGYRWLTLDSGRLSVKVVAQRQTAEAGSVVEVRISEAGVTGPPEVPAPPLVAEGRILFDTAFPEAPRPERVPPGADRPSPWGPEAIYEDVLFHGPDFRGVASLDALGDEGARATLEVLPTDGLIRSCPRPVFLTDPVLLDVIGQVVGLWAEGRPESRVVFIPFSVEALDFFGPPLPAGERVRCLLRGARVGGGQVRADMDVVTNDDRVWARCRGWEDRQFEMPPAVRRYMYSPREHRLAEPWPAPTGLLAAARHAQLFRLSLEDFPHGFFTDGWAIWQRTLALTALGPRERAHWQALPGRGLRRTEWLLGRMAAKDAVRQFLKDRYGLILCPADVEILPDGNGRPVVHGLWADQIPGVPLVSIAHSGGLAVALVGGPGEGVGVDVEWLDRMNEHVERMAFTPAEGELLAKLPAQHTKEWALRLWCAKEAVSKALGRGLLAGPQSYVVTELDQDRGTLRIGLTGNGEPPVSAAGVPLRALTATTAFDGSLALATCFFGPNWEANDDDRT